VAVAANNYKVDFYQATVMNGTTFKPGECKLELKDNQVILKQGKTTAEAAVKVENGPNKYFSTSVAYTDGGRIQEIRLGGTTTKLVFEGGETAAR
jgi:hypothetical protein